MAFEDQAVFDEQLFMINLVESDQGGYFPYSGGRAIEHNFIWGRKLKVFRCFCLDLLQALA